jgi:hypothetical protein
MTLSSGPKQIKKKAEEKTEQALSKALLILEEWCEGTM